MVQPPVQSKSPPIKKTSFTLPAVTSSSSKPSNGKTRENKIKIEAENPGPFSFFYMCLMVIFKKFVFAPAHVKIGVYIGALLICSVLKDFNIINNTNFFAQKNNFLNKYLVKFGWGWTLIVCGPFIAMTSAVYTGFNFKYVCKHLSRLAVGTAVWFCMTTLFDTVDTNTGRCLLASIKSKKDCKAQKHEWIGFDISGHTFLLIYCLLIMLEEAKVFYQWDLFKKKLLEKLDGSNEVSPMSAYPIERATYWFRTLTPLIKFNFSVMAFLALLYEVMLLTTFLYFHTMMHKLIAAFAAVVFWFLTYKSWYPLKSLGFNPGLPGVDGMV